MLLRHTPTGLLAPYVHTLWTAERGALPHARERSLPTGCADLVVPLLQTHVLRYDDLLAAEPRRLPGAVVHGPRDRLAVRGTGGASVVVGAQLRPAGAAALFGGDLAALRNRSVPLELLWGAAARELHERLLAAPGGVARLRLMGAWLGRRLRDAPPFDPGIAMALRAFARDPAAARVEPVQRLLGWSPATFSRRFERSVGLSPKRHAGILRFNALLPRIARTDPRDWARLAPEAGYYDQSHLVHEFRRLAGITPAAYAPWAPDQPTHVPIPE